jgi:hypothetical protein
VAVAERKHWADRDKPFRRPGTSTPFRRSAAGDAPAPETAVPVAVGAEETAEAPSRHWTELGTATRRPRTSDRPEVTTPPVEAPARTDGAAPGPGGVLDAAKAGVARVESLLVGESGPGILGGQLRDIRPHRAAGARREPTAPGAPRGRGGRLVPLIVLALSVLVIAAVAVYVVGGDRGGLAAVLRSSAGTPADRTVTAPLGGRQAATFELGGVTSVVTVRTEDLGDDLYRITTPEDSASRPWAALDKDTVRLSLSAVAGAPAGVEVLLTSKAVWTVKLTGGAQEHRVDLGKGQVAGVELAGGARGVELTLPAPQGTVGVSVTGAVDQLVIRSPQSGPVRLKLAAGAKTVSAGQRTLRDVTPGATFTPRDWEKSGRYDVTVASQATLVSVENGA